VLKGAERWCTERELSVNPSKTEMMLFTRKYKVESLSPVIFYGKELMLCKQAKHLGVILDPKLSWKLHVDAKCNKALAAFYQVRNATGKPWGTSPKVVHWIYMAVIRPMLAYAAVIWWPRARCITMSKQLTHVQQLVCLYITGAMRTTPTAAMELLVGLVPLPTFIQQEAMMAYYRLRAASQWIPGGGERAKISQRIA